MERIGVVIRPREGGSGPEEVRREIDALRRRGHRVSPRLLYESGDGVRTGWELGWSGVDRVLVVGGDGTVNEVVNGLMVAGWSGRFAVIPYGTGNDFAAGLGIPPAPADALAVALAGATRSVDVARVNDRHFVNVSTGGFGAHAAEEASDESKRLLGPLAYLVTGAKEFVELRPSRARIETEAGLVFEGELLLFAVGNGRRTGGGTLLTPRADPSDGLLDLVVVPARPRLDFLALLPDLRAGTHLDDPAVVHRRARSLVVEADSELSVNADGERIPGTRFVYGLAERRLRVVVPG